MSVIFFGTLSCFIVMIKVSKRETRKTGRGGFVVFLKNDNFSEKMCRNLSWNSLTCIGNSLDITVDIFTQSKLLS